MRYYLIESTLTGQFYTCIASDYGQAVKIFKSFKLVEWNNILNTDCLKTFKKVTIARNIAKTNIISPPVRKTRKLVG